MTRTFFFGIFVVLALLISTLPVNAQEVLPKLPDPLQELVNQGAQIRYLGKEQNLDGWVAIKNGQEQYFYVLPGGGFLTGILFDDTGKAVTVEQVRNLRASGDDLLDKLTDAEQPASVSAGVQTAEKYEFKSPSERMFFDIENSNWVPVGKAGTPLLYAFIDPQCPHCHEMMTDILPFIEKGEAQVRLVPVGFKEESMAQAAYLLATPNPGDIWLRHLKGDTSALPAKSEISQQGVQRNLAIMQSWKFDATPMVIYRARDNSVKIVRGRPKDVTSLIGDLGARS